MKGQAWHRFLLWGLFFLISMGLGYPTLNRYDPRQTGGLSDTQTYYELATAGPEHADVQLRGRMLVPMLARVVAEVARGRTGTWEPVFFGFLVVNSLFAAATVLLIADVAGVLLHSEAVGIIGALLYLLNFETANVLLAGMTDAADGFFLMAVVWSLLRGRLWLLPVWGLAGAAAKETFVPLALVFLAVWWLAGRDWKPFETAAIATGGLAAVVGVTVMQSLVAGSVVWPWAFAGALVPEGGHWRALVSNVFDRNVLFVFIWLLPAGLPRLGKLPTAWIAASGAAALTAVLLAALHGSSPGASARPLFTVAGPLLSLSAALWIQSARPARLMQVAR